MSEEDESIASASTAAMYNTSDDEDEDEDEECFQESKGLNEVGNNDDDDGEDKGYYSWEASCSSTEEAAPSIPEEDDVSVEVDEMPPPPPRKNQNSLRENIDSETSKLSSGETVEEMSKSIKNEEEEEVVAVIEEDDDNSSVLSAEVIVEEIPSSDFSNKGNEVASSVFLQPSQEKCNTAAQARAFLFTQVRQLPYRFGDTIIHSFGQVLLETIKSPSERPAFSSSSSIYPVGFTCIHSLFSPTHGRTLRMKCEILEDNQHPVFRISWGRAIDELSYPSPKKFKPAAFYSPEINVERPPIEPELGMRCRVRFDEDQLYDGIIIDVNPISYTSSDRKRKKKFKIRIQYDDGGTEDTDFPDEEIELLYFPTSPLTSLSSAKSPVPPSSPHNNIQVVKAPSALEAWAKVLISLGLIDEIVYSEAMEALSSARLEGRAEVKEKSDNRKQARARQRKIENTKIVTPKPPITSSSETAKVGQENNIVVRVIDGEVVETHDQEEEKDEELEEDEIRGDDDSIDSSKSRETISNEEEELQSKVQQLLLEYEEAYETSQKSFLQISNERILAQNKFLCSPFISADEQQQISWLAALIRKEKVKMGSTGNKRKVLTATDLLEKMDTFFGYMAPDLDRLIEGLPGSENCSKYVFHANRAGIASTAHQSWVHDVQIRHERERERDAKARKEENEKAYLLQEKEMKRQKLVEVNQKRKVREEERLSRLSLQVDERLFKEACFQREKSFYLRSRLTQENTLGGGKRRKFIPRMW